MRRALALLAIALLAGLAAWKVLSTHPSDPPVRSHAPVAAAPDGPSVTTAPSTTTTEPAPPGPAEPPPPAPVEDKRPARVHGVVTCDDGVEREAEIHVGAEQGRESIASTRTLRDGKFSFEVPAGEWSFCASAPGWIAWPETVTLTAGEEYELDLYLERGATVWGWVTGPDASPLAGATLLCSDGSGLVFNRGKTDANGQYRLMVPAQWCAIGAESDGLSAVLEAVEPAPGREVRLDLRLGESRSLSGRVADEEGRPVPSAAIELFREFADSQVAAHPAWRTETDSRGAFTLNSLPEAVFSLSATASSFLQTWVDGVAPGRKELVVVLARGARVTGQVVRKSDGLPVEKPTVRLVGVDRHANIEGSVGEEGRFTITAIQPGCYFVAARANGFAPAESATFLVGTGGVVEGILVELSTGGTLQGVILDEKSRQPIEGARISVMGPSVKGREYHSLEVTGSHATATSDGSGRFELRGLAAGETRVDVSHKDYARFSQVARIVEGSTTDATFLLPAAGEVQGFLLESSAGKPVRNGKVRLCGERTMWMTSLSQEGHFSVAHLPAGRYILYGFSEEDGRTTMGSREVEVGPGEVVRADLSLHGGARLSGRVRPPTGEVLTLWARAKASMIEFNVHPDANGAYEMIGVPSGEYQVTIGGLTETITLPEGNYDIRRDFDLPLDTGR